MVLPLCRKASPTAFLAQTQSGGGTSGGATYVGYGLTTCAAGFSVAYVGSAYYVAAQAGQTGIGSAFCGDSGAIGGNYSNLGAFTTQRAGYPFVMTCVVCVK